MLDGVKNPIDNSLGKMLLQCFIGDYRDTEACLVCKSSKIINTKLINNRTIFEAIVPISPYLFRKSMPWFARGVCQWFFYVFYQEFMIFVWEKVLM